MSYQKKKSVEHAAVTRFSFLAIRESEPTLLCAALGACLFVLKPKPLWCGRYSYKCAQVMFAMPTETSNLKVVRRRLLVDVNIYQHSFLHP